MTPEAFSEIILREIQRPLEQHGFSSSISCSGRLYLAEFRSPTKVVCISFEPGDDYADVLIFSITDGVRSDPDDRAATPRLRDLNARYKDALKFADRTGQPELDVEDPAIRRLMKMLAELRTVLPLYLRDAAQ